MKKAWEVCQELLWSATPPKGESANKRWEKKMANIDPNWGPLTRQWSSRVTGSQAPERVLVGGIQGMYHMGYDVSEAEKLIAPAIEALNSGDRIMLNKLTARVYHLLDNAQKIPSHPFWKYRMYESFDEYCEDVKFPECPSYDMDSEDYLKKIHAAWVAQVAGSSLGTEIEGYMADTLKKSFGDITGYLEKPQTYNDDITFELAFLDALSEKGRDVTSDDIAESWVGLVPSGWSAEDVALRNIGLGIYPPESGIRSNPWREWIGAQMRGAVIGMVAPADPKEAARLAWIDGCVSHHNNGIIGEVFNAVLVSLSFVVSDTRELLVKSAECISDKSEFFTVISFALDACKKCDNYYDAWKLCEEKYREYNWIHAYPNAAAEVVAIWFSEGDFDRAMNAIAMMGQDVDCNGAQIANIYGIIGGIESIDDRWISPVGDMIKSYVRGMGEFSLRDLAQMTVDAARK